MRETEHFARHQHDHYEQSFTSHIQATATLSDTVFHSLINQPIIYQLMRQANSEDSATQNAARQELHSTLGPAYQALKAADIQQLHFHLPNNHSFLRFHRPELFGDDLTPVRPSVVYANNRLKPFHGFEEGRIFNGYRHVYPLLDNGEHLGSVEISNSLLSFKRVFQRNMESEVDFLLYENVVANTVFAQEQGNYATHPLHPNLVIQNELANYSGEFQRVTPTEKAIIIEKLSKRASVVNAIERQQSFFTVIRLGLMSYSVQLSPLLSESSEKPVGVVLKISPYRFFSEAWPRYLIQLVLFFIVAAVFAAVLMRQRRLYKEAKFWAQHDSLTGLFNRSYFSVLAKKRLQENTEARVKITEKRNSPSWHTRDYTLLMLDIDRFKAVNDQYGHDTGDVALELVAECLRDSLSSGELYCRWGGEEFMILVRGDSEQAQAKANALRLHIQEESDQSSKVPKITVSIGLAAVQFLSDWEGALKRADVALYKAKANGRNQVVISE
ncbi:MAG: diguanylate cyclase [Aliidiomarina sp.]|uniref:diguanylate cyclase n=1 Tax=Aliidiomarina sp. TaxID=1872439 RepID=UPI0025BEE471|nr:diguanylate cyclase [Aliidiomarina sp.]MCH8500706.1 diguanylate cyclase [Aliidiomarina sp.]